MSNDDIAAQIANDINSSLQRSLFTICTNLRQRDIVTGEMLRSFADNFSKAVAQAVGDAVSKTMAR